MDELDGRVLLSEQMYHAAGAWKLFCSRFFDDLG